MYKNIIYTFIYCMMPAFLAAQKDAQTCILTEDGFFTVSLSENGKDMILFNTGLWDDIVCGTKFVSDKLPLLKAKTICIEIANKKLLQCKAGIGFRCGIFDCIYFRRNTPALVNNANRICTASIIKLNAQTVKIVFLDWVDWESLQNNQ